MVEECQTPFQAFEVILSLAESSVLVALFSISLKQQCVEIVFLSGIVNK